MVKEVIARPQSRNQTYRQKNDGFSGSGFLSFLPREYPGYKGYKKMPGQFCLMFMTRMNKETGKTIPPVTSNLVRKTTYF